MARNTTTIEAPRDAVWAVLEDAYAYPDWVVGTDRTVDADPEWPRPGSAFRVHVALGHVDSTTSRLVVGGEKLVIDAASSWLGPACVTLELRERGPGATHVTLIEDPAGKVLPLRWYPPAQLAIKLRNVESLRRLRRVVLART